MMQRHYPDKPCEDCGERIQGDWHICTSCSRPICQPCVDQHKGDECEFEPRECRNCCSGPHGESDGRDYKAEAEAIWRSAMLGLPI